MGDHPAMSRDLTTALILFAHGARDPAWADPMRRVATTVKENAPYLRVELAFLEFMKPQLEECAETLVDEGFERIVVLPVFLARSGHLKRDVPPLVEQLRTRNPQTQFELADAIGEADRVVRAMARHALVLTGKTGKKKSTPTKGTK